MFFSFDLADSTAFKAEHPSLWSSVFTCFYSQMLENLGVEDYKTPNSETDDLTCVRKLWKLIGDEILIYVRIVDPGQLYTQLNSVNKTLHSIMNKLADKVAEETGREKCCIRHCQDVREVILSSLGVKATAWLAECHDGADPNAPNIIYCPTTTASSEKRTDFLGREIDEGFRIAKYAVKNKIILSPLLAWMIWKKAQNDEDEKGIIKSNFKITAFIEMKGVWKGRKVPLVMFHQSFHSFWDALEYDEPDLETYANIKEAGFDKFSTDRRFDIDRIDDILKNVHKSHEAERLYESFHKPSDVEIISDAIERKQEFHVACMIFDKDGRILVHNDPERGYEFGCLKKIFGFGTRDWKSACEEGYREKYNIVIKVQECPIPVATYYYEKSNAFGLIVMADYDDTSEKIAEKEDWDFHPAEELVQSTEKSVENFKENINRALQLRQL